MQLLDKTLKQQQSLAQFCRTGENEPVTSNQENTAHYRRLVFNIILDNLTNAYPLTVNLLSEEDWEAAVDYFFKNHACSTAQIWKLPLEFYEFYKENNYPTLHQYPFINELLMFEWIEIEVFMMEDINQANFKDEGDIFQDIFVPNEEIMIQALEYPIHIKNAQEIVEADKSNYFVAVHREYESKQVKFNNLSYPFVEMLVAINENEVNFEALEKIYAKYEQEASKVKETVKDFLLWSLKNNLLLGYKK